MCDSWVTSDIVRQDWEDSLGVTQHGVGCGEGVTGDRGGSSGRGGA